MLQIIRLTTQDCSTSELNKKNNINNKAEAAMNAHI